MTEYLFHVDKNVDEIINSLNIHGIAFLKDFVTSEELNKFRSSFYKLFENDYHCLNSRIDHPNNPDGKQVLFNPQKAADEGMPEYLDLFHSDFINAISKTYFEPNNYNLNPQIILNHLRPSEKAILPWHFDRIQSLKFWIYLKDTTRLDGAFEYCPGSHWEGRYRAGYHMATGTPVRAIPNDIAFHRIQNPVTLEARAGDLIIFDPDGFHRGGVVTPGHERLVIRADTYPIPGRKYHDRPFTPGWFATSPFNFSKFLKGHVSRTLGTRTMDSTLNREGL